MCGIFAILNKNCLDENIIKNFSKISNRGPEFSKIYMENNNVIGFHRLSINGINEKSFNPSELVDVLNEKS